MEYTKEHIPSHTDRELFILRFYQDKNKGKVQDEDFIEQGRIYFNLTEEQIHLKVTSNRRTFISYLNLRRTWLKNRGYLKQLGHWIYEITDQGLQRLANISSKNMNENIIEPTKEHMPSNDARELFILKFYRDKVTSNYHDKDFIEQARIYFNLTEEQIHLKITPGGHTFVSYQKGERSALKRKGYLSSTKRGIYEITEKGLRRINELNQDNIQDNIIVNEIENIVEDTIINNILVAKNEIGTGSESIYIFSYPTYRENANLKKKKFWLHKIGRTRSEDLHRVLQQTNTAVPEKPEILLHIRTDSSILMENAIHTILKLRGKHSKDSPGNEWFKTNCSEIEEIYLFIMNIKK